MTKTKMAILFGGVSEEHLVSVKSAREVARHLDLTRFDPLWIGITRDGEWNLCDGPIDDWEVSGSRRAVLSPDPGVHGLLVEERGEVTEVWLDVVLPVLHGTHGEDGAIQGLLELSGIPYVGCDIQSSVLCMDKSLAYVVVRSAGIDTPTFWSVGAGERIDAKGLVFPVFVKPARSGSSFGVSRVDRAEDLAAAIRTAREYDDKVVIEGAVAGSEVGCAVLEDPDGLSVGEVDQISLSSGFFRIHQEDAPEAGSENSSVIVPADISAESRLLVQQTAKAIYRALGCRGLARVDMFLTEAGEVVLNEVNTLPGLTTYSRYPRMMAGAGVSLPQVLDRLVAFALEGRR